MIVRESSLVERKLEILMIQRAVRDGDPWSGDMAFPGGRVDKADGNSLITARRETFEEIGLNTHHSIDVITRLSDIKARPHVGRRPLVITPYLFKADQLPKLSLNEEVEEVVWVPLSLFMDDSQRQVMVWERRQRRLEMPCYYFQERKIWGLSLKMLDELTEIMTQPF
jgi:8-oxo-dGTP pyrophosphatase MutT (NUDIX family)